MSYVSNATGRTLKLARSTNQSLYSGLKWAYLTGFSLQLWLMRLLRSLWNHLFLLRVSTAQSSLPNRQRCQENILAQTKEKKITVWLNWLQRSPCDDSFFHLSVHCADSWRIYCRKERQSYLMSNCNVTIEFSELWHVQLLRCDYRDVLHSGVPKSIRGL